MSKKHFSAEDIEKFDRRRIWHPFTRMGQWVQEQPLLVESGSGSILRDIHGREYIDAISSLWVNIHGHNRPEINRAIEEQLGRISHSTLLGSANVPAAILAEKLIEIAPGQLEKVFYSDDGSTGVEVALKQAYQFWRNRNGQKNRREKFARLQYAYHGDTIGAVSVGGIGLFHETYRPLLFDTVEIPSPYCYRCPLGKDKSDCGMECLQAAEKIIGEYKHELAALIMEPLVQGAAGFIVHPEGYLAGVAAICRQHGVLLILDEVAVGFGRTGTMFACEQESVEPDFLVLSKGITGGYLPLAATLSTEKIFEAFVDAEGERTFYHGHSYTGNQLACAAAIASLDIFESDNVLERIKPRIEQLAAAAETFFELPVVGDVRQKGLMAAFELVQDSDFKKPFAPEKLVGAAVCREMVKRGVLMRPLGDVVYVIPPLSISEQELSTIMNTLYDVVKKLEVR